MRSRIGFYVILAYVAIVAAAVLSVGCSGDPEPVAETNTPNLLAEGIVLATGQSPVDGQVELTRTLRNDGTTDAGEFVVEYYLSADAVLDPAADLLAATETVEGLAAGADDTRVVTLACGGAPGSFHCIASIDPADLVSEIDEDDNLAVSAETLMVCSPPNLRAEGTTVFGLSPAVRQGSALDIAVAVSETEAGLDVAAPFEITTYLSPDATVDPEVDLPLAVTVAGPLAAGASEVAPVLLTLDEATPPGRWYVGSHVDSSDVVTETDEADNTDALLAVIDVLPPALALGDADLTVHDSRAALPWNGSTYELASGSRFICLVDVLGLGETPRGEFRVGVYFSDDDALTDADVLVGSATVTAADVARGPVPIECRAPDAAAGTAYRWGAIVDDLGAVAEVDETNNSHVNWTLEIVSAPTVDLIASFINEGPPIMALEVGRPRVVNFWLASTGSTESGFFSVKLYASPDDEITGSGNDIEVGYVWFRYLPAGYSSAEMGDPEWATVEVPVGTAPGNYRLGYIVDVYDQVAEADETNNALLYPARVEVVESGAPDLVTVMHDITLPGSAGALTRHASAASEGATWPLVSVGNYGTRASPSAAVGLYAAPTPTADPSLDVLLGSLGTGALEAGEFRRFTDVPLDLSALCEGTHYLYASVDPSGAVAESDETNNHSDDLRIGAFAFGGWVTLEVAAAAPNLTAKASPDSSVVIDSGAPTSVWLAWEVSNTSLTDDARPSAVSLWLSTDSEPTISEEDSYLMSDIVGQLPPATRAGKHVRVEIPATLEVGRAYHIKAMADSAGEVSEADESDNVGASRTLTVVVQP